MTLNPLPDAISFIRKNVAMFFPNGPPNALTCVQQLVAEVVALGAKDVQVLGRDGWWLVASPFDWFVGLTDSHIFNAIIALPEAGANASRVEVVLHAFAEGVVTWAPDGERSVVVGSEPPRIAFDGLRLDGLRVVAFRFDSDV